MKSLYSEDFKHTPESLKLLFNTKTALEKLFAEWVAKGYSPREIAHLMGHTLMELELKYLAKATMKSDKQ